MIDPDADPPRDPFALALEDYRARFGDTPTVVGIESERYPALAEELRRAIRVGCPLTDKALRRALGMAMPPPGALI